MLENLNVSPNDISLEWLESQTNFYDETTGIDNSDVDVDNVSDECPSDSSDYFADWQIE